MSNLADTRSQRMPGNDHYARTLHQRSLGVVVPVSQMALGLAQVLDTDKLGGDATAHAVTLANAQLPWSASDCEVTAQLARALLLQREQERQQEQQRLESDHRANHAQFEQCARHAAHADGDLATSAARPVDPEPGEDPQWSDGARQHAANTRSIRTARQSEVRSSQWTRAGCLLAVVFFVAMEVALVSQLNPVLVPLADPTLLPTWLDLLMQTLAALMLVTCYGAASLLFSRAHAQGAAPVQQIGNGLVGTVLFTGGALLTANITWPAFGPMVEGLLTGHATASGMTAPGVEPTVPMVLRLLTAAPLMGIGLMTGLMVRFAVQETRLLRVLRPLLRESQEELKPFDTAEALRSELVECRAKKSLPSQDLQHILARCADALHVYLDATCKQAADEPPAHHLGTEARLRSKAQRDQIRGRVQAAVQAHATWREAFCADNAQLLDGGALLGESAAQPAGGRPAEGEASLKASGPAAAALAATPMSLLNGAGGGHSTPAQPT